MYMDMTTYTIMGQYGYQTQKVKIKKKKKQTPTTKQETKGKGIKGILELGQGEKGGREEREGRTPGQTKGMWQQETLETSNSH